MSESPRVLSIQSHVVYGYVGNKSATFPLQLLGFEVDAINSVQLCNHTGYSKVAGQVLSEKDLDELVQGLAANGLDRYYTHLLTGYIGSGSFLTRIAALVQHLKSINPNLIYVCDPVMGDNGEMYVPPELLSIYRETIVPLADIVSPNQFEIELLTKNKINSIDDAWKAMADLHAMGCKTVVLSSTELGGDKCLLGLASNMTNGNRRRFTIDIPKLPGTFTGAGDLFVSLFLAWMHRSDGAIKEALEKTTNTMQKVLQQTVAYAAAAGVSTKTMELKLIQSKSDIEKPSIKIFAKAV